jgi:hypothetical protein
VTKWYDEAIEVSLDPAGGFVPVAFTWRGRRYEVDRCFGFWRAAGEAWDPARAYERDYLRVQARPAGLLAAGELGPDGSWRPLGAVYDLYCARGAWRLARVWD